jgi:hypothetical protein
MRPIILLAFVLCGILYAVHRFTNTSLKDEGNISHFGNGLKGVLSHLSKDSRINFICENDDVQKILEARYVLFPLILDFEKDKQYDTALIVLPISDSSREKSNAIIWKNNDDKFRYYLIKKTASL